MTATTAESWLSKRARLASLLSRRGPDDPDVIAARRDLDEARERGEIEQYRYRRQVEAVLAKSALSESQKATIRGLLTGATDE